MEGESVVKGTLEERFWAKVDKRGPDKCWPWTGARNNREYGQICIGGHQGRLLLAHRVSWELAHGSIPKGMCVLHRCDNPLCVNPCHLFLGTHRENMEDSVRRWTSQLR